MGSYEKYYKEAGIKKIPDADELAEIIEAIINACRLTNRQERVVRAIVQ